MVFQINITMKFRLIGTETGPVKTIKWGVKTTMGTLFVFYINYFQNILERCLIPLGIRSVIFIIPV